VDQVHHVLGQHREDDTRTGWISGLDDEAGEEHPTIGGLRIGKELNERPPDEPYDPQLEWDRDGQYFHYLTKWMHALNRTSQVTGNPTYRRWAVELAETAHKAFTYASALGGQARMYWKMSIDLTRPLVPSMGHHDPLDGYLTYQELAAGSGGVGASASGRERDQSVLHTEIDEMARICEGKDWATDDPLGLGGLLTDAYRALQFKPQQDLTPENLPEVLLEASHRGLQSYTRRRPLSQPAQYRLAFRELGLSIGLHAVGEMRAWTGEHSDPVHDRAEALAKYTPLAEEIEGVWLDCENRRFGSWIDHYDINRVMLATSLAPESYLKAA
jgi:hypothetical protein